MALGTAYYIQKYVNVGGEKKFSDDYKKGTMLRMAALVGAFIRKEGNGVAAYCTRSETQEDGTSNLVTKRMGIDSAFYPDALFIKDMQELKAQFNWLYEKSFGTSFRSTKSKKYNLADSADNLTAENVYTEEDPLVYVEQFISELESKMPKIAEGLKYQINSQMKHAIEGLRATEWGNAPVPAESNKSLADSLEAFWRTNHLAFQQTQAQNASSIERE